MDNMVNQPEPLVEPMKTPAPHSASPIKNAMTKQPGEPGRIPSSFRGSVRGGFGVRLRRMIRSLLSANSAATPIPC
jgi:hypothetical protein